jgi:hypothetical protein
MISRQWYYLTYTKRVVVQCFWINFLVQLPASAEQFCRMSVAAFLLGTWLSKRLKMYTWVTFDDTAGNKFTDTIDCNRILASILPCFSSEVHHFCHIMHFYVVQLFIMNTCDTLVLSFQVHAIHFKYKHLQQDLLYLNVLIHFIHFNIQCKPTQSRDW